MARTTAAEAAIHERIRQDGRITFCRFMEMALYSAPGSYYGSGAEPIGPQGDYFTSPEVHPSFGALVARQVEQLWIAMDRPDPFTVVEMGAGTGALARDILSYTSRWSPDLHEALAYTLIERGSRARSLQQGSRGCNPMAGFGVSPRTLVSSDSYPDDDSVVGCFLSNELPDSFPVHRVTVEGGALREIYVEVRDGRLAEVPGEPSRPEIASYFERLGFLPPEGCRAEVNLAALEWMTRVARCLRRGAVLTLDYGYPAEELYSARHRAGTLLCFYRHTLNDDPYARVGQQDMTTHVDFTSLTRDGLEHGLQPLGIASQRSFLPALGMGGYLATLPEMGLRHRDYEANRLAMLELLKPDGLGRVQVLVQQKGLDGFEPAGLRPAGLRRADLQREFSGEPAPLLTPTHMRITAPPEMDLMMDTEGMWRELLGEDDEQTTCPKDLAGDLRLHHRNHAATGRL